MSNRRRLLVVNPTVDIGAGGAETFLFALLRHFARRGIDSTVLCQEADAGAPMPVEVVRGCTGGSRRTHPRVADEVGDVVRRIRPDAVFINSCNHPGTLDAIAGLPTVRFVHVHGYYCPGGVKYHRASARVCTFPCHWRGCWPRLLLLRCGSVWPWRHAAEIDRVRQAQARRHHLAGLITASDYVADRLRETGHRMPILTRPLFVSPPAAPPPRLGFAQRDPAWVFVGRLVREKGVLLLPEIARRLPPDTRGVVIGDGPAAGPLTRRIAALGLSDRIEVTGWLPRDRLFARIARCRVALAPALWPEPFGLTGPESLLVGTPVVAFAVGGIPQWGRHPGTWLIRPGDPAALTAAAARLLTDEGAWTLASDAAQASAGRFGEAPYFDDLDRWLATVLDRAMN